MARAHAHAWAPRWRWGWLALIAFAAGCAGQLDAPVDVDADGDGDGGGGADAVPRDLWRPGDAVASSEGPGGEPAPEVLVGRLDLGTFKASVEKLAGFGTRFWSQQGNVDAGDWLYAQLQSYGYAAQRHSYSYMGQKRDNIYATKVGTTQPDRMYLIAAHYDSYSTQSTGGAVAPGADDNASGTALVLEAARVLAAADVETERSVRFIIFNNEETGLDGSKAYVADRQAQQGVESPPGSGAYPEPEWLGMIAHDMILYDHGLPPAPAQSPNADIDIEYQASHAQGGAAIALAQALLDAGKLHAKSFPAEVGANMANTDSAAFQDACPAVSVRENQRIAEIGKGSNPHWHKSTDQFSTYSDADFLLGFDTVKMTVGAVATLAKARLK